LLFTVASANASKGNRGSEEAREARKELTESSGGRHLFLSPTSEEQGQKDKQ